MVVLAESVLALAVVSGCLGAATRRRWVLLAAVVLALGWCAGIAGMLLSPCYHNESCAGLTFGDVALLLWSGLGAALVMSAVGWATRSAVLTLTAGAVSLVFCWAGSLSIGLFLIPIPLVDFGLGVAFLRRLAPRSSG